MFVKFLDYCKKNNIDQNIELVDINTNINIFDHFPFLGDKINNFINIINTNITIKSKFNRKIIMNKYNIKGKQLGNIMKSFKNTMNHLKNIFYKLVMSNYG